MKAHFGAHAALISFQIMKEKQNKTTGAANKKTKITKIMELVTGLALTHCEYIQKNMVNTMDDGLTSMKLEKIR